MNNSVYTTVYESELFPVIKELLNSETERAIEHFLTEVDTNKLISHQIEANAYKNLLKKIESRGKRIDPNEFEPLPDID